MQFLEIAMEGNRIGLFGSKTVSKPNKRNQISEVSLVRLVRLVWLVNQTMLSLKAMHNRGVHGQEKYLKLGLNVKSKGKTVNKVEENKGGSQPIS